MKTLASLLLLAPSVVVATVPPTETYEAVGLYDCGDIQVRTTGTYCADSEKCPYIAPVMQESATITVGGATIQIPILAQNFPNRADRVDVTRHYMVSSVTCLGHNRVAILYWGGGNCSNVCEVAVEYRLSSAAPRTTATLATFATYKKATRTIARYDKGVLVRVQK
jgi:hypothetical protein